MTGGFHLGGLIVRSGAKGHMETVGRRKIMVGRFRGPVVLRVAFDLDFVLRRRVRMER